MELLHECRLILPDFEQDKVNPVDPSVQTWLEDTLVKHFGGYTRVRCTGGYKMADGEVKFEGGWVYDVATDLPGYGYVVLIALGILRRPRQETVYVRGFNGTVYIGANAMELGGCQDVR